MTEQVLQLNKRIHYTQSNVAYKSNYNVLICFTHVCQLTVAKNTWFSSLTSTMHLGVSQVSLHC